jgi:hypothetical protein
MITCPACRGRGTCAPLHGPFGGYVSVGDYIMVARTPGYTKCKVTGFVHSGIKLIHDGRWTFRWPDGREETRPCRGRDTDMMKVCLRCRGEKEIEPTDLDNLIQEGRAFLVSGKGTIRAAQAPDGRWWAHALPSVGNLDLLTSEGEVYRPSDFASEGAYQSFNLEAQGTSSVVGDIMNECALHGWHIEDHCPECP